MSQEVKIISNELFIIIIDRVAVWARHGKIVSKISCSHCLYHGIFRWWHHSAYVIASSGWKSKKRYFRKWRHSNGVSITCKQTLYGWTVLITLTKTMFWNPVYAYVFTVCVIFRIWTSEKKLLSQQSDTYVCRETINRYSTSHEWMECLFTEYQINWVDPWTYMPYCHMLWLMDLHRRN